MRNSRVVVWLAERAFAASSASSCAASRTGEPAALCERLCKSRPVCREKTRGLFFSREGKGYLRVWRIYSRGAIDAFVSKKYPRSIRIQQPSLVGHRIHIREASLFLEFQVTLTLKSVHLEAVSSRLSPAGAPSTARARMPRLSSRSTDSNLSKLEPGVSPVFSHTRATTRVERLLAEKEESGKNTYSRRVGDGQPEAAHVGLGVVPHAERLSKRSKARVTIEVCSEEPKDRTRVDRAHRQVRYISVSLDSKNGISTESQRNLNGLHGAPPAVRRDRPSP